MIEGGQRLCFALEAREAFGVVREEVRKNLDRDVAIQFGVARAVDLAL